MYVSIRIKGHLDPSWQEYLEGLEIVHLSLLSLERSERAQKELP